MSRLHKHQANVVPVCLAINGCSSLEQVTDFIERHPNYVDLAGNSFSTEQLAAQYAFEQTKLDRKGYDSRRICKYLGLLSAAGIRFNTELALQHADDLINRYTADFGQDEDGDATFRIRSQTFRLKTYDCWALWARVKQAKLFAEKVSTGSYVDRDELLESELDSDFQVDFTVQFAMIDLFEGSFATLSRYVTADHGKLCVEDLVDFEFTDYPDFHDESGTMIPLMKKKSEEHDADAVQAVSEFIASHRLDGRLREVTKGISSVPQKILNRILSPRLALQKQ
ncbi:MAG: hypothetical protein LUC43_05070 [Burkholderiales bacterium]|nr:hypothetical protein [Burkholderiales bacterium]